MSRQSVRILLVEDHASFRQALGAVLELDPDTDLVAEVQRGEDAAPAAEEHQPDVAVVDLDLPGIGGVEAIAAIRRTRPSTRCLVLTALRDEVELGRAIEAGAAGIVHKSASIESLLAAIRDVADGATLLAPESTSRYLAALSSSRSDRWRAELFRESLSPRELEVLECLTQGRTTDWIANELDISAGTVQTHIRNLLGKLDVSSRLEAVALALRLGIVAPPGDLPGIG